MDPDDQTRRASAEEPKAAERQSSWLELFFDLVFVSSVAALAEQLHADHSLTGLAVFVALFVPVWWAWRGYTWYASGFDTDDLVYRFAMFGAMAAAGALAAGVKGAAHGDSRTFVIAYAALFYLLTGLYARGWRALEAPRRLCQRYVIGYAVGASVWLASLTLPEAARPLLWAAAMVVLIATPISVLALPEPERAAYHPRHIAERYGLFTLIVLGESIVVTVASLDTGSSAEGAIVALLGFVLAAAIWWHYFARWRPMPGGSRAARNAWAQGHLLIFAGIAAAAVGVEFCVEAAVDRGPLELADRLPLGAGLAAYMIAMAAIRAATHGADWVVATRLAAGAAALALALLGGPLGPLALVALSAALLVGESILELRRAPPTHAGTPSPRLPFAIRER